MRNKDKKTEAPAKYYVVDESKLEVGDVIVTTTGDKVSRGIRIATMGKFSHVTIYAGVGYYLDATNNGVQSNLLNRMLLEKPTYGKVLRFQKSLSEIDRTRIVSFVRYHIGKEYSVPQAMLAGVPMQPKKSDSSNRQFCSRLIAEAYANAGYPIVTNASFCTPQQVNISSALKEEPDCIRQASQEEILSAQAPDQGLTERMKYSHNEVLSLARELTGADIQEFTSLSKFATTHPEHDQGLADILRNTGYLDFWQLEFQANPFLYDASEFEAKFVTEEQRYSAALHFTEKNESVLSRYSETLQTLKKEFGKRQSVTVKLQLDLYDHLLRLYDIRRAIFQPYLSRSVFFDEERWAHMPTELLSALNSLLK